GRAQRLESSEHRPARIKKPKMLPRKILRFERYDRRIKVIARDACDDPRSQALTLAAVGGRDAVQQVDDHPLVVNPVLAMSATGPCMSSGARANWHDLRRGVCCLPTRGGRGMICLRLDFVAHGSPPPIAARVGRTARPATPPC